MRLRGKYISVMVERAGEYVTVGLSTACALAVIASPVEVAAHSSAAKEFRGGRYEYSISIDKLYGSVNKGDTVQWAMDMFDRTLRGEAVVSSTDDNAPVDGHATQRIALKGVGMIDFFDVDDWNLRFADTIADELVDLDDAYSEADGVIDFNY